MAAGQQQLAQGAAPSTPASGISSLYILANKAFELLDDGGLKLTGPVIRQAETLAVRPQLTIGSSAAPVGNVSTVAKMMGLAVAITPQVTGRLRFRFGGVVLNSLAIGSGTNITGRYGTGAAPVNAAASTGTQWGIPLHYVAATVAAQAGFFLVGNATGFTLNVAVWVDLELLAVVSGGATIKDVMWEVEEY